MPEIVWERCVACLQSELPSQQFNTWIKPLRAEMRTQTEGTLLHLQAPNRFIKEWVVDKFLARIRELLQELYAKQCYEVVIGIGAAPSGSPDLPQPGEAAGQAPRYPPHNGTSPGTTAARTRARTAAPHANFARAEHTARPRPAGAQTAATTGPQHGLSHIYTFERFVRGTSNELALAAATQVAKNPGSGHNNPLFIYGDSGLGKTHLMHAVGNVLLQKNPQAHILYCHSQRFVDDMVKAMQLNSINDFKRYYHSADALLIDDIQFLRHKERSQEEFFHTYNALLADGQQLILTSDDYPKNIDGLEDRLKSRFGAGVTVAIDPPELETRAAILMKKAVDMQIDLSSESALFLAGRIRSNVRELEGALSTVIASAHFHNRGIDTDLIRESLRDLLAQQDRNTSLDNIQRTTAIYYNIRVADLTSHRRNRSVVRPRQIAMALARELTSHSLPEIGDRFGGRDHTTVLHACRRINQLREENPDINEDYNKLLHGLVS